MPFPLATSHDLMIKGMTLIPEVGRLDEHSAIVHHAPSGVDGSGS